MVTPFTSDAVRAHFDDLADEYDHWKQKNAYYYRSIQSFIRRIVPEQSCVLEVGCGTGEVLASLKPSYGVGVDLSPAMIQKAREKFPQYEWICSSIETLSLEKTFDYIIMVDVIDHCPDILGVFEAVRRFCHRHTQIILTTINPWWEPILKIGEWLRAKMPEGPHNFIEKKSIEKFLDVANFEVVQSGYLLFMPKYVWGLAPLINAFATKLWLINKASAVQTMVIRPKEPIRTNFDYGCSVIIPCRNEAHNIAAAIPRIPMMGRETEIILVDDGSTDGTTDEARRLAQEYGHVRVLSYFPGRGKGHAVQQGFEAARHEVVVILDADLSVPPEELPWFFNLLNRGQCRFVNGTRMIYPMEKQAMRFLNLLGNKFFSLLMRFITGVDFTDTLCGTKALYKKDVPVMRFGRDPWGDFDLLFSAVQRGFKILEVPVHYQARHQGKSKMKAFRHAVSLMRACWLGFRDLVFCEGP